MALDTDNSFQIQMQLAGSIKAVDSYTLSMFVADVFKLIKVLNVWAQENLPN